MNDDDSIEVNPFAVMTPTSPEDVARCIEGCYKELTVFARSMAPPDWVIRSSESYQFNQRELLQETALCLLKRGRVPDGWTFLTYAWWVMRGVRYLMLARRRLMQVKAINDDMTDCALFAEKALQF